MKRSSVLNKLLLQFQQSKNYTTQLIRTYKTLNIYFQTSLIHFSNFIRSALLLKTSANYFLIAMKITYCQKPSTPN